MKNIFFGLIFSISTIAFAQSDPNFHPGPVSEISEGHEIVRAMILNPKIGEELRKNGLSTIGKITRQKMSPSITEYKFEAYTCGNCFPKTGFVRIIEDLTPTFTDDQIEYTISITVE